MSWYTAFIITYSSAVSKSNTFWIYKYSSGTILKHFKTQVCKTLCYFLIKKKHSLMTMIWSTVSKLWFSLAQKKHKHRSTQIQYRNYYSCSTQGWLLKAQTLSPHYMQTATGNYLFPERLLTVCSLSINICKDHHVHMLKSLTLSDCIIK